MATVIQNPLKSLGDQFYREAIEHCRTYNARLRAERNVRLPFIDSQTGVAQNNCYIWMERHQRGPGMTAGQMYTYPARCWRKKRRLHTALDPRLRLCGLQLDGGLSSQSTNTHTLEALLRGGGDEESLLEIQRVLEADAQEDGYHDDDDDFDVDTPKRKHRGKGRGRGSGRRRADPHTGDDQDKPYVCDICAKRYRNRTGLSYHYSHAHLDHDSRTHHKEAEPRGHSPATPRPRKHPNRTNKSGVPPSTPPWNKSGKAGASVEEKSSVFPGAEELFGSTSESDTSTFHGFEEEELEEHTQFR